MEKLRAVEGWRTFDEELQLIAPWYTRPCLEWLKTQNWLGKKVYEYGAGDSTFWWRKTAFSAENMVGCVISIETSEEWGAKVLCPVITDKEKYLQHIHSLGFKYDVIIIDGQWRNECTHEALKAINPGGYIIIDNYHQATCDYPKEYWQDTDSLLEAFPVQIYQQPGHPDWKTAVFHITNP